MGALDQRKNIKDNRSVMLWCSSKWGIDMHPNRTAMYSGSSSRETSHVIDTPHA